MRKKIMIIISILLLAGLAAGSYWYLQLRNPEDPIPESGIFVLEDTECRHSM